MRLVWLRCYVPSAKPNGRIRSRLRSKVVGGPCLTIILKPVNATSSIHIEPDRYFTRRLNFSLIRIGQGGGKYRPNRLGGGMYNPNLLFILLGEVGCGKYEPRGRGGEVCGCGAGIPLVELEIQKFPFHVFKTLAPYSRLKNG